MPFFGDQAHEGDEPHLRDECRRWSEPEEGEDEGAEMARGTLPEQHDERIAEAAELGGKHQIDEADGKAQRDGERGALGAELAAFAGVVDGVAPAG
jgi:hypothetical protein